MRKTKKNKKTESMKGQLALQHIQDFAEENEIDQFDLSQGINVFVRDFRGGKYARELEYLEYVIDQEWGYKPGRMEADQEYEDMEVTAQMVYDELVNYFGFEGYMESKKQKSSETIFTIQEDTRIPGTDYILEEGDRVRLLSESRYTYTFINDAYGYDEGTVVSYDDLLEILKGAWETMDQDVVKESLPEYGDRVVEEPDGDFRIAVRSDVYRG